MRRLSAKQMALRAEWFRQYADELVKLMPSQVGRIDWATAEYFYLMNKPAFEAALGYAERHAGEAPGEPVRPIWGTPTTLYSGKEE